MMMLTRARTMTIAAVWLALALAPISAHDIPADVLVQMFVKPEGQRLSVLLRVPLAAMRDVNFPMHGQNFLNLPADDTMLTNAALLWIVEPLAIEANGVRLAAPRVTDVRVSLPSDKSFASYDQALAHVHGPPLQNSTELVWNQALLDLALEYTIDSDRAPLALHPAFERLGVRVVTVLRFLPPGGAVRAFEFTGDPGRVNLDPTWRQAAWQFVKLGFAHILDGTDHLLFLFCLVVPIRRLRPLVLIVTAFTVAHSITLFASAFDLAPDALWFPPLIETLIATSIVYMAVENIVFSTAPKNSPGEESESSSAAARASGGGAPRAGINADRSLLSRRWLVTFAFGLIHGFGFSFALKQTLQFAGTHLLASLLAFNVGIEIGQIAVLLMLIPALHLLFRFVVSERIGVIILSALAAHTAWHWMTERFDRLRQFNPPAFDAAFAAAALRWVIAAVAIAGVVWAWKAGRGARRNGPGPTT
jgi:hypothetical protein